MLFSWVYAAFWQLMKKSLEDAYSIRLKIDSRPMELLKETKKMWDQKAIIKIEIIILPFVYKQNQISMWGKRKNGGIWDLKYKEQFSKILLHVAENSSFLWLCWSGFSCYWIFLGSSCPLNCPFMPLLISEK